MSTPMAAGGAGGDEAALLAFKAAVISGGHGDDPLALWNTTSGTDGGDYCGWERGCRSEAEAKAKAKAAGGAAESWR
jgi:hypothetical protein